jgi:hypothetical protein
MGKELVWKELFCAGEHIHVSVNSELWCFSDCSLSKQRSKDFLAYLSVRWYGIIV